MDAFLHFISPLFALFSGFMARDHEPDHSIPPIILLGKFFCKKLLDIKKAN
jgi:hypothetical protein